jgi:ABC-2 type transport system ATP-binding protein
VAAKLAPEASVQETLRAVFDRGLDVSRFEMKEPSLHDAFIVLTAQDPDPERDREKEAA